MSHHDEMLKWRRREKASVRMMTYPAKFKLTKDKCVLVKKSNPQSFTQISLVFFYAPVQHKNDSAANTHFAT